MNIVEKFYGDEIFYEDAFNEVVPEVYENAIKEEKLDVVSKPDIQVTQIGKGKAGTEPGMSCFYTARTYRAEKGRVKEKMDLS